MPEQRPPPAPAFRGSHIASPCVRRCCLDDNDVCLGCHRSLEEIERWSLAGDAERLTILRAAAQRRQQANTVPTGP